MDLEAARLLYRRAEQSDDCTLGMMQKGPWEMHTLDEDSGLNIAMFYSGMGDGAYASYWGLDSRNEICCLVTDFGVLSETKQA